MAGFKKLLEPSSIGKVKTRNRIIKTGASMLYWHENDISMNPDILAYYEALAKGGAGLIIVESPNIDYPIGGRFKERYRLDDDRYIKGMKELTDIIHKNGCSTFMQMEHEGPWQNPLFPGVLPATFDGPPVGASPVKLDCPGDFHNDVIRELAIPEIETIIDKYASCTERAKKAGFDGIDINSGSSHIMHNFLSPFWNKRKDAYGGTQEKRAKLLTDTIKEIKRRNGKDFPVTVCLSGIEIGQGIGIPDGDCFTHELMKEVCLMVQAAGADAIQVRSHWLGYHVGGFLPEQLFFPEFPVPLKNVPKLYNVSHYGSGANVRMAESVRKTVSIPVIVVGRIDFELGEKVLEQGKADFIAMHRPFLADPEFPNKLASGRRKEIRPCTRCGTCLDQSKEMHRRCRINAALGTDSYMVVKANKKKKVMIIGGGPGGMEAARVAALRGHDVTLYDKASSLGGLMPTAAFVKGLEIEDLATITDYFKVQFKKLGVKTKLGKSIDLKDIEKIKPDAVVLAEGGIVYVPDIKGINGRNVVTSPALHKRLKFYLKFFSPGMLRWLTNFYFPAGKRNVIIGSGMHGLEIAEFFLKRGRKVTIVDTAENPGEGMLDFRLGLVFPWLKKKNVIIYNGLKEIEVVKKGIQITTADGKKQLIEADTVVPAIPSKPSEKLNL